MATSCGLIIRAQNEYVLLAHATKTPRWDIPKGRQENNETYLETALRECWEETNIHMEGFPVKDLGKYKYLATKDLYLFLIDLPELFDLNECKCHTFVKRFEQMYPETDQWSWIHITDIENKIGKNLASILKKLQIIP